MDGIGITPACAGKTPNAVLVVVGTKDHPRVCGKDMDGTEVVREAVGSPPRVRERHLIDPLFIEVYDPAVCEIHSLWLTGGRLHEHHLVLCA